MRAPSPPPEFGSSMFDGQRLDQRIEEDREYMYHQMEGER